MTRKKAKQLEDGTLVVGTTVQRLAVKLDEKAIALAGVRLATVLQKHGEFELQAKGVRDGLKQQEAAIQSDIDTIAASIRAGVEQTDVVVEIRADFVRGVAEFVRTDTGETITSRSLTDEERQKKMIFEIEEADEAADEAEHPPIDVAKLAEGKATFLDRLAAAVKRVEGEEPPPPSDA